MCEHPPGEPDTGSWGPAERGALKSRTRRSLGGRPRTRPIRAAPTRAPESARVRVRLGVLRSLALLCTNLRALLNRGRTPPSRTRMRTRGAGAGSAPRSARAFFAATEAAETGKPCRRRAEDVAPRHRSAGEPRSVQAREARLRPSLPSPEPSSALSRAVSRRRPSNVFWLPRSGFVQQAENARGDASVTWHSPASTSGAAESEILVVAWTGSTCQPSCEARRGNVAAFSCSDEADPPPQRPPRCGHSRGSRLHLSPCPRGGGEDSQGGSHARSPESPCRSSGASSGSVGSARREGMARAPEPDTERKFPELPECVAKWRAELGRQPRCQEFRSWTTASLYRQIGPRERMLGWTLGAERRRAEPRSSQISRGKLGKWLDSLLRRSRIHDAISPDRDEGNRLRLPARARASKAQRDTQ